MPSLDEGLMAFLAGGHRARDEAANVRCDRRDAGLRVDRDRLLADRRSGGGVAVGSAGDAAIARGHVAIGGRRRGRGRVRDAVADQARGLPDQREPHVRPPVRHVPGGSRCDVRLRPRGAQAADPRDRPGHARGHPALLRVCPCGVEPGGHGRVQPERGGGPLGIHAAAQGSAPQLLDVGVQQRAVRQLLRQRTRTLVPQSPLLDRCPVRRCARQSSTPSRSGLAHLRL